MSEGDGSDGPASARTSLRQRLDDHPMAPYYLILGASMLLLATGLMMVLSASSIESYDIHGSAFTLFSRQAAFALVGLAAMILVSRLSVGTLKRAAPWFLIVALLLLVVVFVPGVGVGVHGQRNWIRLAGPFRLQPSEFAKLALILWAALIFSRREAVLHRWRELIRPFLPVAALLIALVLAEGDLGTSIILSVIVAGLLFVAGTPLRVFGFLGAVGVSGIAAMSLTASYRMDRFRAWLHPEADLNGAGWQITQGKYALGSGGWWGVGLGGSREKWGALPEAHTDFIFPIIGEELGIVGALTVIGLFGFVAVMALRIAIFSRDSFVRIASVGIVVWIIGQALINLGAVLQLLPITGVPLPFVSYGGSSLLPSLMAVGVLLAFARSEAAADQALRHEAAQPAPLAPDPQARDVDLTLAGPVGSGSSSAGRAREG